MAEAPLTRVTLLVRIQDTHDTVAWGEFVQIYGPVIFGFARKRGLQEADAADLTQDVLRSVARNISRLAYDRQRGTFRGWLYTITRNKVYNFLNSQRKRARATGDSAVQERLDAIPNPTDAGEDEWELDYQRQISAKAMERVQHEFQENTWKAFTGTAVEGRSAQEVGNELGMSAGAVYVAKSRVLARLRQEVQDLIDES